jgi:hypothetical protein
MFLSVIDEFGEYERLFGHVSVFDLKKTVSQAKELDFKCLQFISFEMDTIFNQLQMKEMLVELNVLSQKNKTCDILVLIREAITVGLVEDYLYIKFELEHELEKMNFLVKS